MMMMSFFMMVGTIACHMYLCRAPGKLTLLDMESIFTIFIYLLFSSKIYFVSFPPLESSFKKLKS